MVFDWVCYRHRDKHGSGLALCVQRNAQGGTMSGRAGKSGTLHSVLRGGLAGFRLLEFRRDGFPCRRPPTCWHTRCAGVCFCGSVRERQTKPIPGTVTGPNLKQNHQFGNACWGGANVVLAFPPRFAGQVVFLIRISDLFLEHCRRLTRNRRHRLTERRKMLLATF